MQPALWVCLPSAEPVCDWLKTPAGRRPSWPGWPGGRLVSLGSLRCWWIFRQGDRISLTRVYTRHCKTPPTFSPHTLSRWLMTARHISTLSCGLFTNLSFTDHLSLLFKFFFFWLCFCTHHCKASSMNWTLLGHSSALDVTALFCFIFFRALWIIFLPSWLVPY